MQLVSIDSIIRSITWRLSTIPISLSYLKQIKKLLSLLMFFGSRKMYFWWHQSKKNNKLLSMYSSKIKATSIKILFIRWLDLGFKRELKYHIKLFSNRVAMNKRCLWQKSAKRWQLPRKQQRNKAWSWLSKD